MFFITREPPAGIPAEAGTCVALAGVVAAGVVPEGAELVHPENRSANVRIMTDTAVADFLAIPYSFCSLVFTISMLFAVTFWLGLTLYRNARAAAANTYNRDRGRPC